jgi:hypothetical protein
MQPTSGSRQKFSGRLEEGAADGIINRLSPVVHAHEQARIFASMAGSTASNANEATAAAV